MTASELMAFFRLHWVRAGLGFAAMSLASVLAFHVGADVAAYVTATWRAPDAASPARAAVPPVAAKPSAAPTPAPESPFVIKSILKIDEPIKFGQYFWDESKAPDGPRSGPLVITVDIQARTISVFRGGHEIAAAAILRGFGDKPTPTGVFPITQKDADHVSTIYDAPMPWMMRLTNDGISIHGAKVERGYATNGCIGVPDAFAKRLFEQASLGDKVIITDGQRIGVGDPILQGE
jgi:lipoprotein-anchoring transpeptidase ErfK/SrfK